MADEKTNREDGTSLPRPRISDGGYSPSQYVLIRTGATRRELATRWETLAPDKAHRLVAARFAGRMAETEEVMKAIAKC